LGVTKEHLWAGNNVAAKREGIILKGPFWLFKMQFQKILNESLFSTKTEFFDKILHCLLKF